MLEVKVRRLHDWWSLMMEEMKIGRVREDVAVHSCLARLSLLFSLSFLLSKSETLGP